MSTLIFGLLALLLAIWVMRAFARANPALLAKRLRAGGGLILILVGLLLLVTGRAVMSLPLLGAGIALLGSAGGGFSSRTRKSTGAASRVRSAALEMELDIDTGAMRGWIVAGRFAGRNLDALSEPELAEFAAQIAGDSESSALLEAYLNRRGARGRAHRENDANARNGRDAAARPMREEEAYQILGLQPGAGADEIRGAHRALMKKIHPDQGGTTYLAARVNEAREVLLRRHGG